MNAPVSGTGSSLYRSGAVAKCDQGSILRHIPKAEPMQQGQGKKKPKTSVTVVNKTTEATAGSAPARSKPSGIRIPANPGHQEINDHRQRDDAAELRIAKPNPSNAIHNNDKHDSIDASDQYFLADDAHRVARREFFRCQRPHGNGQRLRTGISSHRRNNRHQDRQCHDLFDGMVKKCNNDRRKNCRRQIDEQSRNPDSVVSITAL